MRQAGLFGLSDQLKRLSDCGDPRETMSRVVDFEVFRPALESWKPSEGHVCGVTLFAMTCRISAFINENKCRLPPYLF
jgi:hypothetical protein